MCLLGSVSAVVHDLAPVEQTWFSFPQFLREAVEPNIVSVCRVVVLAACKSSVCTGVFKSFQTGEEEETGDLSSGNHWLISCLLTCASVFCVGGKIIGEGKTIKRGLKHYSVTEMVTHLCFFLLRLYGLTFGLIICHFCRIYVKPFMDQ